MRVLTIVLAFGAGLAVFAATRAGAPAEPPSPPSHAAPVLERAALAATRHDFRRALALARRARALDPGSPAHFPVLVDALVELGRFRAAERALQRFVDRRPGLPAYARVSYLRELRGDLAGAARAMELAVAAGAAAPEDVAAVQVLLGDLEAARGRTRRAARDYALALAGAPGFAPALEGRAELAAARGELDEAIALMRRVVRRQPLPEHAAALGELQLAAGRPRAARRSFARARREWSRLERGGADIASELAVFEADHGSPRAAVALARRAWTAAPGLGSADALGWALTRAGRPRAGLAWSRRALRLGSRDPLMRFHAGVAARGAERRRHLRVALANGLARHPWHAAAARRALE